MAPTNSERPNLKNVNLSTAESFQLFYTQSSLVVFRFIYGLRGGPTEEVEDLTAETFIRAWKSRRRFSGTNQAALGWLLKIARNLVIDSHRREKVRDFSQDIEQYIIPSDNRTPEEEAQVREQVRVLWSLLHSLPDQQREILVLRYILGWRVQDIGKHLDIKENTVSVTIRRAIKNLRQAWPTESE